MPAVTTGSIVVSLRHILRNLFSSWAGYGVTLLVGFLLAPMIVHRLGNSGYGVWTLIVSLTGYCGLLDLGLRSALMRFVSRGMGQKDPARVNVTLSSAMALLGTAGVLAFVVTVAIHGSFARFNVDADLGPAARTALLICGLNISLVLPLTVFSVVLPSLERYDVTNAITICTALLRAALVVTVLKLGFGIVALSMITLAVTGVEYGAHAILARKFFPQLRLSVAAISASTCRELFSFGLFRFIWIVANQLIFYTDSVVIGLYLNVGAITGYAIAASLVNYGRNIVSLATNTLLPATNRLDDRKDIEGLRALHILGTRMGSFIGLALCTGYIAFGDMFIRLWMGDKYASSAVILRVLVLPQFASMSQYMSTLVLVGTGRHRFMAFLAITEAILNVFLSILLIPTMGVLGVAWGTAIPHAITAGLVIPYAATRAVGMPPRQLLTQAYVGPLLCTLPAGALSLLLVSLGGHPSWPRFVAYAAVHCGVIGLLGYLFCLGAAQKESVRLALGRMVGRLLAQISLART